MPRDLGDLDRALSDLASRLDRVETRLGIPKRVATPMEPPPPQVPVIAPPMVVVADPGQVAPASAAAPAAAPSGQSWTERTSHLEESAHKRAAVHPPVHPPAAPPVVRAPMHARQGESFTLEQMIGGKLFAVAGGLILLIGMILFVKLGIDRRWFTFPPGYRCMGGGVAGLLLIGVGEWVRRKLGSSGTLVAAGIAGAGLAAMYGSAFAAFGMYRLIEAPVAFALLGLISAGGVALALHARSLPLAILALIGAYLNPLLMGNQDASALVMPSYLLALMIVGLSLSAWRPSPFRWLRSVVWWGTAIDGMIWIFPIGGMDHPFIVLGFLGAVWVLVHAELYFGARRVPEGAPGTGGLSWGVLRAARPMISSFATTIWTVGVGIIVVEFTQTKTALEGWNIAAAGLLGTSALALMLAANLRAFRDPPETDSERLGVALWTQAGSLLITTVAMALSDWMQVVAWLSMGLAALAAGRWAKAKALEGYGLVVLAIAAGRLIVYDSHAQAGGGEVVLGLVLTRGTLLLVLGAAAWVGAALLLNRASGESAAPSARRRTVANLCVGVGICLAFIGTLNTGALAVAIVAAAGAAALGLLLAGYFRQSRLLTIWGGAALLGVSIVSIPLHLGAGDLSHWRMAVGTMIVTDWSVALWWLGVVWMGAAWVAHRSGGVFDRAGTIFCVGASVVLMLVSLITEGTSRGGVCVVWVGMGLGLLAAHMPLRRLAMDVMAMAVMVLATALWMFTYVVEQNWLRVQVPALAHPGLWVGLAVVAGYFVCTGVLSRGKPRRATSMDVVNIARTAAGILLFACTSLEVSRSAGIMLPSDDTAQRAAVTIWWSIFAVGMLVSGFAASIPVIRHVGLGLLCVAAAKALFVDLISIQPEWRVASFLMIGVLMLVVAFIYAWLDRKARRAAKAALEPPPLPMG